MRPPLPHKRNQVAPKDHLVQRIDRAGEFRAGDMDLYRHVTSPRGAPWPRSLQRNLRRLRKAPKLYGSERRG